MQTIVKASIALLVAALVFYLSCFGYRLATQVLYYLSVMTMILLHLFGIHPAMLQSLVAVLDVARNADEAMLATGAIAGVAALVLVLRHVAYPLSRNAVVTLLALVPLLFAGALFTDIRYGVTPVSEIELDKRTYNSDHAPIEHRFSVEQIMHLENRLSGARAEVEGTLDFEPRMKRFRLMSPAGSHHSVYVQFFKGRRTMFSELSPGDRPRYYDQVSPLIGHKVKIFGKCVNGQIDADVADVEAIPDFTNGGDAILRPLQPI